jgi:hypothetical protein
MPSPGGFGGGGMGGAGGGYMPGGTSDSGSYGGGGFGGSGKQGMIAGSVTQDAQVDPNLIDVELYGIVYIYNPVNRGQLEAPADGAAPPADAAAPATIPAADQTVATTPAGGQ